MMLQRELAEWVASMRRVQAKDPSLTKVLDTLETCFREGAARSRGKEGQKK